MSTSEILHGAFEPLGEATYHARIAQTPGDAIVLFSHAHCGACRAWTRLLPEALSQTVQHFYEVDVALDTGMARYFGIFHLPTIYLYRDGLFHAELQAEARVDTVQRAAHTLFNSPAQEEP